MNFINKTVLVTGASSGIGAAIALKFAIKGANVVIIGRNKTKLSSVHEKIEQMGKKVLSVTADITNDNETKEIVEKAISHFRKLDVLVNNAGIAAFGSILSENSMEIFDQAIRINLRAAVQITHLTAKHLIQTKGNIVNISSIGSMAVLTPTNFPYCTSKAGLDHFTRSTAMELSKYGVRVNSVNPGPVKTDYLETMGISKEEQQKVEDTLANSTMLGKLIDPEEVADIVVYLASDMARSVTGSSFVIDNGTLLNNSLGI